MHSPRCQIPSQSFCVAKYTTRKLTAHRASVEVWCTPCTRAPQPRASIIREAATVIKSFTVYQFASSRDLLLCLPQWQQGSHQSETGRSYDLQRRDLVFPAPALRCSVVLLDGCILYIFFSEEASSYRTSSVGYLPATKCKRQGISEETETVLFGVQLSTGSPHHNKGNCHGFVRTNNGVIALWGAKRALLKVGPLAFLGCTDCINMSSGQRWGIYI